MHHCTVQFANYTSICITTMHTTCLPHKVVLYTLLVTLPPPTLFCILCWSYFHMPNCTVHFTGHTSTCNTTVYFAGHTSTCSNVLHISLVILPPATLYCTPCWSYFHLQLCTVHFADHTSTCNSVLYTLLITLPPGTLYLYTLLITLPPATVLYFADHTSTCNAVLYTLPHVHLYCTLYWSYIHLVKCTVHFTGHSSTCNTVLYTNSTMKTIYYYLAYNTTI